jgi:DNA-directed RNA polymerase specialized sigma24 family protein
MITLESVLMAEGYEDLKQTIKGTVDHFWLHHGGSQPDLQQDALLEFVRCYHDWDVEKSQFKTWLVNRIRWKLIDRARVELSRKKRLKQVPLLDMPSKQQRFNLEDFIDSLSEDARMLVFLAFEIWGLTDTAPREIRIGLRTYLRKAKWTHRRIKEAFWDVRGALI